MVVLRKNADIETQTEVRFRLCFLFFLLYILEFRQAEAAQIAADEDVAAISKRLIKKRQAYEALAK